MRHLYCSEHIITPVGVSEAGDGAMCVGHSLVPQAPTIACVSFPARVTKAYRVLMAPFLFSNASIKRHACAVCPLYIIMCKVFSYHGVRY